MALQRLFDDESEGQVLWCHDFFSPEKAQDHYDDLEKCSSELNPEKVTVFGKQHTLENRRTAQFGTGAYLYAGGKRDGRVLEERVAKPEHKSPMGWIVRKIRRDVEGATGEHFNNTLVTRYAPGAGIGAHADDETTLDPGAPIVSVSFGATRTKDFVRAKKARANSQHTPADQKKSVTLRSGTLLIMECPLQSHWKHRILKRAKSSVPHPRFSLTFRRQTPSATRVLR